jgi:hypothetical protein
MRGTPQCESLPTASGSCGGTREGVTEALAGETGRSGIEPRNQESGAPTLLSEAEGNTEKSKKFECVCRGK